MRCATLVCSAVLCCAVLCSALLCSSLLCCAAAVFCGPLPLLLCLCCCCCWCFSVPLSCDCIAQMRCTPISCFLLHCVALYFLHSAVLCCPCAATACCRDGTTLLRCVMLLFRIDQESLRNAGGCSMITECILVIFRRIFQECSGRSVGIQQHRFKIARNTLGILQEHLQTL